MNLYPFVPYEEAMTVVIWWVEVVYVHDEIVKVENEIILDYIMHPTGALQLS